MCSDMNKKILRDILNLKDDEEYFIANFLYKKDDDDKYSIICDGDMNFFFIIGEENLSKLYLKAMQLSILYREELNKDLKDNNIEESLLIRLSVNVDDEGNFIRMFIRGFGLTKANPKHTEQILNELVEINKELTNNLTRLLDDFAEQEDLKNNFNIKNN